MDQARQLQRYAQFLGDEYIAQIFHMAQALAGMHVLHLNTTAQGGGVATLLQTLLPLMNELGVEHSWRVVQLDEGANKATTHLVDLLQGNEPGELSTEEQHAIIDVLKRAPVEQFIDENHPDTVCVHDFQLAPLATLFTSVQPAMWFCHIDTAHPNVQAKSYIEQFLGPYRVYMFNSQQSIFPELPSEKTQVVTPSIDAFSKKQQYLSPEDGRAALQRCGIDTNRPLITQVSRFDRWKNPWQVIDIYRAVKRQMPTVQVALVGAMEAADDVRAREVLKDVHHYAGDDPDIHLLSDPQLIQHDEVNAFQRYSNVILQRSTHEGFGLTVTEAMWKYQPVVGTSATGLRRQIVHEQNGYIADDTDTSAMYTLKLLHDRTLHERLGKQAHQCVQDNFLFPMMVREYLVALFKTLGHTLPDETTDIVPSLEKH
ncbi:MAG TPA: glycosyltransferase [Ktedonobacteraceae bacterium]|jgi:trehalose synthase|nr:glycosyltransferase [Ktedonobacteraceae bacterium]